MADEKSDDGWSTEKLLLVVLGVGAALVVGLVVLLVVAAVLGSFVLGLGSTTDDVAAPQASFTLQGSDPPVIRHDGGDTIDGEQLVVVVNGGRRGTWAGLGGGGTVTAGDELAVEAAPGDEVGLRWTGGDQPQVVFEADVEG